MFSVVHRVIVAGLAEVAASLAANKHGHRAAVHALEVHKFVSMNFTRVFAPTRGEIFAKAAYQILLPDGLLCGQSCFTVLHASKVGHIALIALVESAVVDRKFLELSVVKIFWIDHTALLV